MKERTSMHGRSNLIYAHFTCAALRRGHERHLWCPRGARTGSSDTDGIGKLEKMLRLAPQGDASVHE
jgi:hypothetical protein